MKPEIEDLLRGNPLLWRGRNPCGDRLPTLPTGYASLDALLPGGGWPLGGLSEIVSPCWGIGELSLLLPAMVDLTRRQRWLVWVAPPLLPYPPALSQGGVDLRFCLLIQDCKIPKDILWTMDKLLRNRNTGIILTWPKRMLPADLRRLQLAAETAQCLGVLFYQQPPETSLAPLRLGLKPASTGLEVTLQKARGSWCRDSIHLPL